MPRAGDFRWSDDAFGQGARRRSQVKGRDGNDETEKAGAEDGGGEDGGVGGGLEGAGFNEIAGVARRGFVVAARGGVDAGEEGIKAGFPERTVQGRWQPEGQKGDSNEAAEAGHDGKRGGETAACQGTGTGGEVKAVARETREGRENGRREDGRKEAQAAQKIRRPGRA